MKKLTLVLASVSILAFAFACTKKEETPAPATPVQTAAPAPAATQAAATGKVEQKLEVSTNGDNLYFNKKDFTAKAGSTIQVTFKNNASASSGLSHNFVVVKPGMKDQVASDSMQAGEDKGWVAEGPNVIAHTKLLKPGESETITVALPTAGDYEFLCTYPGHNMTMNGTISVK